MKLNSFFKLTQKNKVSFFLMEKFIFIIEKFLVGVNFYIHFYKKILKFAVTLAYNFYEIKTKNVVIIQIVKLVNYILTIHVISSFYKFLI